MSDIFISYARSTVSQAEAVAQALRHSGYSVWKDDALPAHRAYSDVIEEQLRAAKAVVVLWSADAVKSQWVRAEADLARSMGTLVQLNMDGCALPLPFNLISSADLDAWAGGFDEPCWQPVMASIAALVNNRPKPSAHAQATAHASHSGQPSHAIGSHGQGPHPRKTLLAVLAFENLSNDPELGYFTDGVSEEILYTVAAIKDLRVIGRASSFRFRGQDKSVQNVAATLGATHILDGSVRRSGNRLRIHVELVDTSTQAMVWSDRFDRLLTDIFALQDEIAAAIAAALNHHFAPARTPIAVVPRAYDAYLRVRAIYAQDIDWEAQAKCVELLEEAVRLAPDFSQAWGFLGLFRRGADKAAAARRALELDPDCPTALMALAMTKPPLGQHCEKLELAERAYQLAPDEQIVAGTYVLLLVSVGLLTRAAAISALRVERDPLSPLIAGGHAVICRSLGQKAEAISLAQRTVDAFPEAGYAWFIRALIAIFDSEPETASTVVSAAAKTGHALPLQVLLMFMQTVSAMDADSRRHTVGQFLKRNAPTSYIVDIGLAAAMGETDLAMEHLLDVVRHSRPLEFTADNDGRAGGNDIAITSGLFMPNCELLRPDPRFAEVCVRLGLYDCWRELGQWPDCAAEVAPYYDLPGECAKLADRLERYEAQTPA